MRHRVQADKLVPPCNPFCTYNLDTLYTFLGGTNDGSAPHGEVVLDSSGNVYGTTRYGGMGTSGLGSICGDKRRLTSMGVHSISIDSRTAKGLSVAREYIVAIQLWNAFVWS